MYVYIDCDTNANADVCYTNGVVTIKFPKVVTTSSSVKKLLIK